MRANSTARRLDISLLNVQSYRRISQEKGAQGRKAIGIN